MRSARRVSMFERYSEQRAEGRARFKVGQRVRVVGGQHYATVAALVAGSRVNRYRLEGSKFMYFESDLEAER